MAVVVYVQYHESINHLNDMIRQQQSVQLTEKALLLSCTMTFRSMSTMFCLEGIPGGGFLKQKTRTIISQIHLIGKELTQISQHQNQFLQMPKIE